MEGGWQFGWRWAVNWLDKVAGKLNVELTDGGKHPRLRERQTKERFLQTKCVCSHPIAPSPNSTKEQVKTKARENPEKRYKKKRRRKRKEAKKMTKRKRRKKEERKKRENKHGKGGGEGRKKDKKIKKKDFCLSKENVIKRIDKKET